MIRRLAWRLLSLLAGLPLIAAPLAAQESARVELLAPVLAAEDARDWRPDALRPALVAADSFVRQTGAIAVGRIGDPRGVELLVPLLADPDTTVRAAAVFALGLVGDSAAAGPLIDRMQAEPLLDAASSVEAMAALARVGGRRASDFLTEVLQGRASLALQDQLPLIQEIALQAWRLGPAAPIRDLLPLAADTSAEVRWRVVYTLARLRPPAAATRLAEALRDGSPLVRAFAVRAFTRSYADSAGLTADAAAALVAPLVDDADVGVRVNALRSLATFRTGRFASRVASRLDDPVPGVRVEAAATLGALGGPQAVAALRKTLTTRTLGAVQREALIGLARADTGAFGELAPRWAMSADWRDRFIVAEAGRWLPGRPPLLEDRDSRVAAAAFAAWSESERSPSPALLAAARALISHRDAAVRAVAAGALARAPDLADLAALSDAFAASAADSFPDAALGALEGIAAIAGLSDSARSRVAVGFLARTPTPSSYLVRRWAEERWPAARERWGSAYPLRSERTMQDYRELARRFLVAPDSLRRPHVFIETEQRGTIEIELLGPEAPLTVANFLSLVDRRFFDDNQWHRVVPNFVVQAGDPRGDGWGGPGGTIRDEINRVRYVAPVLGMALSGPDTGSSQWFINLSPQPHLDGTYTVFGRVVGTLAPLMRIAQGDVIRRIRR